VPSSPMPMKKTNGPPSKGAVDDSEFVTPLTVTADVRMPSLREISMEPDASTSESGMGLNVEDCLRVGSVPGSEELDSSFDEGNGRGGARRALKLPRRAARQCRRGAGAGRTLASRAAARARGFSRSRCLSPPGARSAGGGNTARAAALPSVPLAAPRPRGRPSRGTAGARPPAARIPPAPLGDISPVPPDSSPLAPSPVVPASGSRGSDVVFLLDPHAAAMATASTRPGQ
jgi:hypothetical protein